MKFVDEFREGGPAGSLVRSIAELCGERSLTVMEVCGTHTMSIARNGIKQLLPEGLSLISGPGCPVCVTPNGVIDRAIALAGEKGVIVASFGDMLKVPGSSTSLDKKRAGGGDVRVVASTLEALQLAEANPAAEVIFIGVGFETTAPTVAASLMTARKRDVRNYSVLAAHKLVPPALRALSSNDVKINGYLLPGHVSAVIGTRPYEFLVRKYGIGGVVSGFEALDILQSVKMLVQQIISGETKVENQYTRVVKAEGNPAAISLMDEVFEVCDSEWRGIGAIPSSGLRIREAFATMDAAKKFDIYVEPAQEAKGCRCGDILQGRLQPSECRLFASTCTPENPVGPCMVSSEGTCAAYYKYNRNEHA